jgi:hypothetical protein
LPLSYFSAIAVVILALGGTLFFFDGRDFFPLIDGGQIQLHVRSSRHAHRQDGSYLSAGGRKDP